LIARSQSKQKFVLDSKKFELQIYALRVWIDTRKFERVRHTYIVGIKQFVGLFSEISAANQVDRLTDTTLSFSCTQIKVAVVAMPGPDNHVHFFWRETPRKSKTIDGQKRPSFYVVFSPYS